MPRRGVTPWDPWWRRALASIGVLRTASFEELDYGTEYANDAAASPAFSARASAAAPTVFPWPYAATGTRAADLAGRRIRVYRRDGDKKTYVDNHWLPTLLERPNPDSTGELLRRQIYSDLQPGGDAYVEVIGNPGPAEGTLREPVGLVRLPPEDCKLKTERQGISGYVYNEGDSNRDIPKEFMLHFRLPSFLAGRSEMFYGTGYVRPMTQDYNAEHAARARTAEIAKRGRPDILISPKGEAVVWNPEQCKGVKDKYEGLTKKGGALVSPGHAKIEQLSWDPDKMQLADLRQHNREATLGVTRTPPIILGLETANFATAQEQSTIYWVSLHSDARLIDATFTQLLRRVGEIDHYVEHDFSDVPALKRWETDAIARAQQLVAMGVPLPVALESQGLGHIAEQIPEGGSLVELEAVA